MRNANLFPIFRHVMALRDCKDDALTMIAHSGWLQKNKNGGLHMKKYWLCSLKNFFIGTMLTVFLWGLFGFLFNLISAFMYEWGIAELYRFIIFVFYWCVLNWWIYGTSNKQRKYLDTLPRDHRITMKEDYLTFLKQEGLPMMIYYTVCLSLQVFVFQFTKGYFQTFFVLLAPIGIEQTSYINWLLSFVLFVIGYQAVSIICRALIRKERYDYLFEHH